MYRLYVNRSKWKIGNWLSQTDTGSNPVLDILCCPQVVSCFGTADTMTGRLGLSPCNTEVAGDILLNQLLQRLPLNAPQILPTHAS